MSRGFINQKSTVLKKVLATAAVDGTSYYYLDMREYHRIGLQYAVAGSGTVTLTVEATAEDLATEADCVTNGVFVDVSAAILGAASKTSSYIGTDATGVSGCYTWLRFKIVVASSSTDTAYSLKVNQTH